MRKTLLIGGGGHARSIVSTMGRDTLAGYVANTPSTSSPGIPYEGDDTFVRSNFPPEEYDIHIAVGYTDGCSLGLRHRIIDSYGAYEARTLIAPSAIVTDCSTIGAGSAIMARTVINGAEMGKHCIINTGAIIEHDCRLGDNVFIGPGTILSGEVTVESDVFIGAGAVIRNGVTISTGVNVGMGAVVTRSLSEPGIYIGNPARKIQSEQNDRSED